MENMLAFSLYLAQISTGYFDPTVITALEYYGYGKKSPVTRLKNNGYKNIVLQNHRVQLHGVQIELGGVGKGYLLQKIVKKLQKFPRFIVNFGGDLYAGGSHKIALEHPQENQLAIGTVLLENTYFCASAPFKRAF